MSGKTTDQIRIEMLVTSLVRCESIAKSALSWLTADTLNTLYGSQLPGMIWNAVMSALTNAQAVPRTAALTKQLFDQASADYYGIALPEGWQACGYGAIDQVFAAEPDSTAQEISRKMLHELYQTYVVNPAIAKAVSAAQASGDWDEFGKLRAQLASDGATISEENIYADPFSSMDKIDQPLTADDDKEVVTPRILTGTLIDNLHRGRGMYRGLMSLLLGPTSGGKSTLLRHLIAEATSAGNSVGMISTEENLDSSDMAKNSLYAACTGINTDTWAAANNDPRRLAVPLTAAQRDRIIKLRSNTVFYSFDSTPTWEDLEARVVASADKRNGKQHDILIIDWAGPLALVISAATKQPPHQVLEEIAFKSQDLAKRTGIAVILAHQLAAERCAHSKIFGPYSELDSQNCKKMAQYSGATYIITPFDGQRRFRFIGAKMRADIKNFEIVAQLDPEHSKVHYLDAMTMKGHAFREADKITSVGLEPGKKFGGMRKH